jgi:hypothetical protein
MDRTKIQFRGNRPVGQPEQEVLLVIEDIRKEGQA